ncbi:MAG: hypothetical protein HUJ88_12925 [Fusobacterium necrophorum]|nr:hypothetical protein [Fusobacterium necrophorum]
MYNFINDNFGMLVIILIIILVVMMFLTDFTHEHYVYFHPSCLLLAPIAVVLIFALSITYVKEKDKKAVNIAIQKMAEANEEEKRKIFLELGENVKISLLKRFEYEINFNHREFNSLSREELLKGIQE